MNILTKKDIKSSKTVLESIINSLNLTKKEQQLKELEKNSLKENFWADNVNAQSVMKQMERIRKEIDTAKDLTNDMDSLIELYNMTQDKEQLMDEYNSINSKIKEFQRLKFLSGKYDNHNVLLSIHAGQGGTEANDWAQMLLRMYQMYCDKKGWKYDIENIVSGNETGISTVTMKILGEYVYGLLKKEHGTHRLVRISPFNAQGLRQTTFAGIEVVPILKKIDTDIKIADSDIEFKAVKSGGPGGQKVNKTSSAVQITHIPTGITVHSSTERSQVQNKENAMNLLKSKLAKILEEERVEEISQIKGNYKQASWGNQIRN
ncbi:TPA: peptide chain release factor 2, partial [Patescibacteria group bacterium]|nr:peptide chain release factor 2 [Patescibacteria group bacterium]